MNHDIVLLAVEAIAVYLLVLWTHSLRSRFGLGPFYALLGGVTAVMSWVTDAGIRVDVGGITFMVGSTVFYTALLLGVFVVYVFDGPRSTRISILTIAGVSILMPLIALLLELQMRIAGQTPSVFIPLPSLRINTASVLATVADLLFLAVAWEFLGRERLGLRMGLRAFLTLLGVMWLDVLLFTTGAFAGTPAYLGILGGTLLSRLALSLFASPFLYAYLAWQSRFRGAVIENRPVLAILRMVAEMRAELDDAQREIARREQAEAALRKSEELLRNMYDNAPIGIFRSTLDGRYASANPALARMLGYDSPENLIESLTDLSTQLYLDPTFRARLLEEVLATDGWVHRDQAEWRRRDGGRLLVEILIRQIFPADARTPCLEGFITDITERKRLEAETARFEAQSRQLQKNESLARLAGAVAHHFNNQLQTLLGNLEIALDLVLGNPELAPLLESAMEAGRKSAELSSLMLTYLGKTHGQEQSLDLAALCRQTLAEFQASVPDRIRLETDLPTPGPAIRGTPARLRQLFTHLLTNAREAIGEGNGTLRMGVGTASPADIPVTGRFPVDWQPGSSPYAWMEVGDTGGGIPPPDLDKIFDPFFTTKFIGRGLGLSVALGVVRMHGGGITVQSEPGRGSLFRVFLPLDSLANSPSPPPPSHPA